MSGKIAIVSLFVALATSPPVFADGKNEVRAVTFDEDAGVTRVHVRGAETPTFTVYKLERPTRVVIDLPQAKLADALRGHESAAVLTPNTWAVSTIAAQQLDDGAVRVIVTMARPGRYDVKTDGTEVIVMVMPRDPAPKTANPADVARMQAESDAAKAEVERMRKVAAEQAARAEAAQRAVDEAKQQQKKNAATAADLERAKQVAAAAQAEADQAKARAAQAQNEFDRQRVIAEKSRRDAVADATRAKADAAKAQAEVEAAKTDMAKMRAEAEAAKRDAMKLRDEAEQAKSAAQRTQLEAEAAKKEAESAKREAAQKRTEAELAKTEIAKAKDESARTRAEAARAKSEADAAKAEAAHAKTEAEAARAAAEAARVAATEEKREAEADKKKAEAARAQAESMLRDAKSQLTTLEKKTAAAQELEDRARAAHAAAQAREEAAREAAAQASQERAAAEAAAKQAQQARDRAAANDRARLIAEAKAAEERLAQARRATEAAELQRKTAEQAAASAKRDLENTKTTLSTVEQQRAMAETAATEAARKRSEAEAAATDASRRRSEAEVAAAEAAKQRTEAERAANDAAQRRGVAEQQRAQAEAMKVAAEQAAREAQAAKDAAEKQRKIAETAAQTAAAAAKSAEASLDELTTRRLAAERAASELEARMKAEAKAQAEIAAATARKAGDDEVQKARAEAARLADERKRAESELADRRKAVAQQQSEATKLETAAAQARDAADREEKRRAKLASEREEEERQLAQIKAQRVQLAATPVVAPAPAPAKPAAPVKPAPTAPAKVAKIGNVTFHGDDDTARVDIAISGDATTQLGEVTATHVEMLIDNAELGAKLERTLDVTRFGSAVRKVSSFRDRRASNRVRVIAELDRPMTPVIDRDSSGAHLRFTQSDVATAKRPAPRTKDIPPQVVGGFGAASTPITQQSVSQLPPQGSRRRIYHGATVDFDFKEAPIHDLLRIIADTGHVSIVVPDQIDAKVTVRLKRVPWDQALEVILASHGLWYRRDGNIYRIADRKQLDAEDEAEAARRKAERENETPIPEIVTLNYSSAAELKAKLEPLLSPKGKLEVDERTNALIIDDVSGNRKQIIALALQLDLQTPQISIEARVVEARSTFVRQFGVQWGGRAVASAAGGNATGLIWPSSIGIIGGNEDLNTVRTGVATPSDFAVNLPASTSSGEGGALGLSLGSVGGNFNINLRLSALEDTGSVRIISAPKITVLNNKTAKISQGVSIPIQVVSAQGTNTQFVQADLSLEVTPYVSLRDCAIAMNLTVTKNEPDFVNVGARGDPTILRKEAKTQMLVNDGETSVLGGIYTRNTGVAYKKIPFFGDLPVIGWFFKNRRENDDRTEILVFITPKITNKASLRCQ